MNILILIVILSAMAVIYKRRHPKRVLYFYQTQKFKDMIAAIPKNQGLA